MMAARRLGGSMVQRAETAAAGGRRRLGPRLMYTDEQAHAEIVAREIQKKIDGLYDLIVKGENNVKTSSWGDAFLVLHLSKRVTPRPADSDWYDAYKSRIILNKIKRAGLISLTFLAYSRYDKEAQP
ncbi:uncharacterized protein [Lolium perenne]|uniref:uncharacterized protein n=1 Tax=Lolium perenne TaxID=4522 RepID=UPI0021F54131|nr:uncharacterized protein LOC127318105 [Lolium perenne]